jgi:hypothetical protein
MKVSKLVEGKDSMDFHLVMKSARWVIMTIQKLLRV